MGSEPIRTLDMAELSQAVRMYLKVTSPEIFGRNKLQLTFCAKKDKDLEVWAEIRRTTQVREDPDE